MADALNQRLHDTLTAPGPTVKAARDQQIRVGDIIMSRSNDITIDVKPARRGARADQVRNGNRWRVAAIDPDTNRLAAERAPSASIDSLASSIQCASSMT